MPENAPSAPSLEASRSFGRYGVVAAVGRGAMGVVYKARDPLLDRDVALKVIRTDLLDAEERSDYLERFMREAQAAARCTHRNIIAVYDLSENDGSPFIVMEFVEGPDLRRVMRESGPLPVERSGPMMMQMLDALGHAHAHGIVHRDIKPPNILVTLDGSIRITDFGIARLGAVNATHAGVVVGTPRYMAPEQALAQPVDLRADLFSAAAVFWEMLTGKSPFAGATQSELLAQIIHGEPKAEGELTNPRHAPLLAALRKALAKKPDDRFASAAQFAATLRQAMGAVPHPASFMADAGGQTVVAPARPLIDPHIIEQAEKELATYIGPLARVLVKKAAATSTSTGELYRTLASNIPGESDRAKFLQTEPRESAAAPTMSGSTGGSAQGSFAPVSGVPVPPEAQSAAQTALTAFVGPIAKVLVRQAASQARTAAEFYDRLLAHLTREEDRASFRRQMRRFLDPRL